MSAARLPGRLTPASLVEQIAQLLPARAKATMVNITIQFYGQYLEGWPPESRQITYKPATFAHDLTGLIFNKLGASAPFLSMELVIFGKRLVIGTVTTKGIEYYSFTVSWLDGEPAEV